MSFGRHFAVGETTANLNNYRGIHRDFEPIKYPEPLKWSENVAGISLGSRINAKPKYGVDFITEDDNNDPNARY